MRITIIRTNRKNEKFDRLIALCGFAFLPINHVNEEMDCFKSISLPDACDLVEYIDSVYYSDLLRRIGYDDNGV